MTSEAKRDLIVTAVASLIVIMMFSIFHLVKLINDSSKEQIKVGFVYDSDESTPYTANFIKAQKALERQLGSKVVTVVKSNIYDRDGGKKAVSELVNEGCDLIFTTSIGYSKAAKEYAEQYPDIQFCQATGDNAGTEPVLDNYHTFMGEIYQGRYISGAIAGMKLRELIDSGRISPDKARIGYVAAYETAEVISGYTAFLLGVRSEAPEAVMEVMYTNTWSSYAVEKKCAKQLIADGCVVISQHSDTTGPAVACEEAQNVYHVGYNQSMIDVAPTTSIISSCINWTPYIVSASEAVLAGKRIEDYVQGDENGNDLGAGFDLDWVQMLELNSLIAAEGSADKITELTDKFKDGWNEVFKGSYTGVDPTDPNKTIDLSGGYTENEHSSAPTFCYVLNDVITIVEQETDARIR
ncbi:MAG: BMP family ABC transporter substrate-binding protein [Ruminococcus sp.]|nr:BMP family ABC transporter substrate-binding protein [Ruminococcus sp.]